MRPTLDFSRRGIRVLGGPCRLLLPWVGLEGLGPRWIKPRQAKGGFAAGYNTNLCCCHLSDAVSYLVYSDLADAPF